MGSCFSSTLSPFDRQHLVSMNWMKIVFSFKVSDVCSTTFLNKTTGNLFASIFFRISAVLWLIHQQLGTLTGQTMRSLLKNVSLLLLLFCFLFDYLSFSIHRFFEWLVVFSREFVYRHQCRLTMLVYDSRRSKVNIHTKNVTVVYLLIDCCVREKAIRLTFFLQHGILPFQRQRNARKNPLVSRGKHSKQ